LNDGDENKLMMLHGFGIPVMYHAAKSYQEGYLDIAEKIKSGSKAKYEKQQQVNSQKMQVHLMGGRSSRSKTRS
jgi:hypothetical protein